MDNLGLIQYLKKKQKQKQIRPKKHKLEAENVTCLFFRDIKETENASHRLGKSIYKRPVSKLNKELHNSIARK